ncbi:MAG: hypothetical protein RMK29_22195 [Myxococcales bacterium]|nr:hypothetical protein [Myxococcota bacterium]MDW8284427.1 hypothetical protein [Myxococcales bacterium]
MKANPFAIGMVGLVSGVFLGSLLVGRATAQGVAPVRRYEYICQPQIEKPWKPEGAMKMNTMGAQG